MTKRKRTILFLTLLTTFFLMAPTALLYTQGYRFDFETKRISRTGGLFLKVWPRQAEVYIDGKLKEKTDFLFGSVLVENLLPKKYRIEIKKEGFHSWIKDLEITEKQVTEAKNIVLFDKNFQPTILVQNIEEGRIDPEQKSLIYRKFSPSSPAWFSYNLENGAETELSSNTEIAVEKKEEEYSLGNLKILKENGILSVYNEESQSFEKFFEPVKGSALSPDLKKLVYFSDHEIWIMFPGENNKNSQERNGEKLFLLRLSEKIDDCLWLNNDYLLFRSNNNIEVTEVDNRNGINIYNLMQLDTKKSTAEEIKLFFNKENDKLYVFEGDKLSSFSFILP
ncbi:MAG: hypothetical protein PHW72_02650 [Candidatus Pacebacteria bacterium]|nr:hypothetical protein [Candidatus Paceibacterota bacterium]